MKKLLSTISATPTSFQSKVPISDAIKRIERWQAGDGASVETKAFFINLSDLISMVQEILDSDLPIAGIRAYLATRIEYIDGDDVILELPVNELLLVPTVLELKDVCNMAETEAKIGVLDYCEAIYNLTTPCPNMCDKTSPLYTLVEDPEESVEMNKTKIALKDLKSKKKQAKNN